MKKTASEQDSPVEPLERARLQADVAKQRVRIAKEELKRARKRLKEAKLNVLRALIERQLIIQDFRKQGGFIPDTYTNERMCRAAVFV